MLAIEVLTELLFSSTGVFSICAAGASLAAACCCPQEISTLISFSSSFSSLGIFFAFSVELLAETSTLLITITGFFKPAVFFVSFFFPAVPLADFD